MMVAQQKQPRRHTSSSMAKAATLASTVGFTYMVGLSFFFPASCSAQALFVNADPYALMMNDSDDDGSPTETAMAAPAPAARKGGGGGTSNSGCSGDHMMVRVAAD